MMLNRELEIGHGGGFTIQKLANGKNSTFLSVRVGCLTFTSIPRRREAGLSPVSPTTEARPRLEFHYSVSLPVVITDVCVEHSPA